MSASDYTPDSTPDPTRRIVLVNGEETVATAWNDRGLQYGDGLFRTMLVEQGAVLNLERHLSHITQGLQRLGIVAQPAFAQCIADETAWLCRSRQQAVVKVIITRGQGGRGYAPPVETVPTRILVMQSAPERPAMMWREGVHTRLCRTRVSENPDLAGIKHLNRLPQVLARSEWQEPNIFEGLMSDNKGCVVGGTMSNVFAVRHHEIHTPALDRAGVAGTQREQVLEAAGRAGYDVHQGHWRPEFFAEADEMFLTNAVLGILPVKSLDRIQLKYTPGQVTRHLMRLVSHPRHATV